MIRPVRISVASHWNIATSPDNSEYVSDAGSWKVVFEDTGWIDLPLGTRWVDLGGSDATSEYSRLNGVVWWKGRVGNGSVNQMFQMPAGFRTSGTQYIQLSSGTGFARCSFTSDGKCTILSYSGSGSNAGIDLYYSYRAEQ